MTKTVINNTKEKERAVYINKVKRFARSKAGLKILKQIAPAAALMIEAHPDWLDIAQYYNDPRLSGNYRVDFLRSSVLHGREWERFATHFGACL